MHKLLFLYDITITREKKKPLLYTARFSLWSHILYMNTGWIFHIQWWEWTWSFQALHSLTHSITAFFQPFHNFSSHSKTALSLIHLWLFACRLQSDLPGPASTSTSPSMESESVPTLKFLSWINQQWLNLFIHDHRKKALMPRCTSSYRGFQRCLDVWN